MNTNEFDKEYYMMSADRANNYPFLNWGSTKYSPFIKKKPIDDEALNLPLKIVIATPCPKNFEMADFLILSAIYATSEKMKNVFENNNVYGVQFFPIEIESKKGDIIIGHYAMHFWNRLAVVDKKNYKGGKPDQLGLIMDLQKFSLNENLLNKTPLEERLVIRVAENPTMLLVHKSIYEAIKAEELTGMKFFRVDEWDSSVMFK